MTSTRTQSKKNQSTYQPVRKVTAGVFTGALVTFTVLILNTYNPFFRQNDNKISGEMAGAATTVLTFIVSYLIPPGKEETLVKKEGVTKSAKK